MPVTPRRLAIGMSLWIPNLFSGIRVKRFADDWTSATVELHVNVFTRNYVKTAFGGSMSAMTDPYFFMLVMHQLGRDYVVWDTRGEIDFVKPGRGVLLPQGFPGEWNYWVGPAAGRGANGDKLRVNHLERLQLSLRREDGTTVKPGNYGIEIEWVTLGF